MGLSYNCGQEGKKGKGHIVVVLYDVQRWMWKGGRVMGEVPE
jgi:hypothetical protein